MDPKNVPPVEEYDNLDIPSGGSPQPGMPPSQNPAAPFVVPPQSTQPEIPQPVQPQQSPPPVPPSDVPPVYEDNGTKKLLLIGGMFLLFFLLILGGGVFFLMAQRPGPEPAPVADSPETTNSAEITNEPRLLPKVTFDTWTNAATASATAESSYLLEIEQPTEEIGRELARKLGFGDIEFGEQSLTGSVETASESAMYMYEVNTGSMFYLADTGKQLTGPPSDQTVMDFLQRFGVYDSSMNVFATYQKTSTPGVTYYEIHRDWEFVGLPILLDIGLVSLPESDPLAGLEQRNRPEVENETIVNTSDDTDGFARAEDFNTITAGVDDETGRVVYLSGNMRQIASVQRDIPLISSEEAFSLLESGNYEQLIPVPAGEGTPGFTDVFPTEVTNGSEAVITDMIPAYVEKPIMESQEQIAPYWVFRGYSELESGYRIRFIATVPGVADTQAPLKTEEPSPAQQSVEETLQSRWHQRMLGFVYASEPTYLTQQQQRSLPIDEPEPDVQESEQIEPLEETAETIPTPTDAPSRAEYEQTPSQDSPQAPVSDKIPCRFHVESLTNRTIINGFEFGMGASPNKSASSDWYYIPDQDAVDTVEFAKSVFETVQGLGDVRMEKWVVQEVLNAIRTAKQADNRVICAARVTGISPSLFYYGTQQVFIKPTSRITYADPPLINDSWMAQPFYPALIVNEVPREFMYYEYNPEQVQFKARQEGWVISRVSLPYWIAKIQTNLQLTEEESSRLLFEVMDTAKAIQSDYVKISLIDRSEVDAQLPISVESVLPVSINRYLFQVEPATLSDTATEPVLTPIIREPEMILEIGGYTTTR